MKYQIELYRRPDSTIINQIVTIAFLLTEQWFTPNVPKDIEKDLMFHDALCLIDKGKILSFIVFTSLDGAIYISLMGTHPEFRNTGLGSMLINHLFKYVKSIGFKHIVVFTVPPEIKSSYQSTVKFYKKHGFKVKKIYHELWERGAIELVKEL
jgi:ribosomal protein S18 acetylase RimI-like enzyme